MLTNYCHTCCCWCFYICLLFCCVCILLLVVLAAGAARPLHASNLKCTLHRRNSLWRKIGMQNRFNDNCSDVRIRIGSEICCCLFCLYLRCFVFFVIRQLFSVIFEIKYANFSSNKCYYKLFVIYMSI